MCYICYRSNYKLLKYNTIVKNKRNNFKNSHIYFRNKNNLEVYYACIYEGSSLIELGWIRTGGERDGVSSS